MLLECISANIDFIVSCTLWVFMVNVPSLEEPGTLFTLTKCVKNSLKTMKVLVKMHATDTHFTQFYQVSR